MEDEAKNHSKSIHKSQNPSTTSTPSRSRLESPNQNFEVVETFPSSREVVSQLPSPNYIPESPEVHSLI